MDLGTHGEGFSCDEAHEQMVRGKLPFSYYSSSSPYEAASDANKLHELVIDSSPRNEDDDVRRGDSQDDGVGAGSTTTGRGINIMEREHMLDKIVTPRLTRYPFSVQFLLLVVSRENSSCIKFFWVMEMGGKVKRGAAGRKGGGPKKKPVSRSVKAGLQFPVGRIGRYLKKGRYSQRVGTSAPVYLAAVLEYLADERMESKVKNGFDPILIFLVGSICIREAFPADRVGSDQNLDGSDCCAGLVAAAMC
ncbi:uncharacterized protein LOC122301598 [Carya illinoinensis]|uniref:uncharacterized protein LOC122301598 n=1 Tax=Carya illinoinensis TaxID=32201 RepID=UPI001C71A3F0|nr:uncharacterized protein LOC122301598 [Carya illinoinensis]